MRLGKRWWVGILAGLVLLAGASVVTGLVLEGGSGTARYSEPSAPGPAIAAESPDSDDAVSSGAGSEAARSGSAAAAPDIAPADGASVAAPAPGSPTDVSIEPQVIRTVTLSLEVGDVVRASGDVRAAVTAAGGIVANERTGSGESPRAGFTVRIPADQLDGFVDRVAGLGTVVERSSQAQDVTARVVDLDARLATQRASVERVRALLARAQTIGEVVAIESELTSREAELESLQRRLAALRGQVALSTVEISVLPAPGVVPEEPTPGFLDGLAVGWAGLRAIGLGLAAGAGFLLPLLPVIALLAGAVIGVRRLRARRRRTAQAPAAP